MQNKVILLTKLDGTPILIGVESIIRVEEFLKPNVPYKNTVCSKIESRHAMVCSSVVKQSPTQIYELINKQ